MSKITAIIGGGRQTDVAESLSEAIKDLIYAQAGTGVSLALAVGVLEIVKAELLLDAMAEE